ncbi:MAG TPA: PrsW family glutamic-type intramembrane protease [Chloroflexota bacterium]|nr:PrsW family glutamic-type intramembrane protease [Chloroflexota bacterium]
MAVATAQPTDRGAWFRVLLGGLLLYVAGLFILALTQNPNLFPTVIMLGNLLVPVAYVAFFYQRRHLSDLNLPSVAAAFFWGGVLGTFAAALLEPLFIRRLDFATAFVVGAIEELAKMLGVLVVARSRRHDREIDGLILGAAAGMGFAALESTGYAFTAFLASRGSLSDAVAITLLRGVLSPVGHGTWTALLASVLFREGAATSFRLNRKVVGAYLLVVALHGLWDGLPDAVSFMLPLGVSLPAGQTIVGIVSLVLLRRRWVEAVRMLEQAPAPDQLEAASG